MKNWTLHTHVPPLQEKKEAGHILVGLSPTKTTRSWLFICLIALLGWIGGTQRAHASWYDGYLSQPWYDANKGTVEFYLCYWNGAGTNEMFYTGTEPGMVFVNDIELFRMATEKDYNTGKTVVAHLNINGLGGKLDYSLHKGTTHPVGDWAQGQECKWIKVTWQIPNHWYDKELRIKVTGTWYLDGPGSNDYANATRYIKPSQSEGIFHLLWGKSIDLRPDGSLDIFWCKETRAGSHDCIAPSVFDTRGEMTLYSGNKGNKLANGKPLPAGKAQYGSFNYKPVDCTEPGNYSVMHKINVGYLSYEDCMYYGPGGNMSGHTGCPYPTSLNLTTDRISKSVKLDWQGNNMNTSANDGYWAIWRKEKSTGTEIYLGKSSKGTYSYTDATLEYNKDYIYTVKWVRDSWSNNTTVAKLQVSKEVKLERGYSINLSTMSNDNSIKLTWTVPSLPLEGYENNPQGNKSFEIWRSDKGGVFNRIKEVAATNATEFSHEDLSGEFDNNLGGACTGHQYYVVVYALNSSTYGPIQSNTENASTTGNTRLVSFYATKGELSKAVKLNWEVERFPKETDTGEDYIIWRRVADSGKDFGLLHRMKSKDIYHYWTDESAEIGVYYEYKVSCVVTCDPENKPQTDMTDVGFVLSTGVVTGKITYGTSGTTVKNAQVTLKKDESSEFVNTQYHALQFGYGGYAQLNGGKPFIPNQNGLAIQFYINPEYDKETQSSLLSLGDLSFGLKKADTQNYYNPTVKKGKEGEKVFDKIYIPCSKYSNVSIVRTGAGSFSFCLVDDTGETLKVVTQELNPGSPIGDKLTLQLGSSELDSYRGNLDELRVWAKVLSDKEILNNYNRLLTGSESDLIGYWQFDEGLKQQFFDYSRDGNSGYNSHHGIIYSSVYPSTNIPTEQQLGLKAFTDSNGNYEIKGIPFSGSGTSYSVIPMLGVHQFSPAQQRLYISSSSLVNNNTTFSDVSSFKMYGQVVYKHGNFPVEGATVLVDGIAAVADNKPVTTDASGKFLIDVPIGEHYVSLSMQGHTFEVGRFPQNGDKYDFQTHITEPVQFIDNTTVRIAGRASGGSVEAAKPLGFGKSVANIGQATILLEPVSSMDYRLNTTEEDIAVAGNDTIQSVSKLVRNSKNIQIETDPATGEFLVLLPPIPFKVTDVSTKSVTGKDFKLESISSITPNVNSIKTDTLLNENGNRLSFNYHERIDFSYISPAKLDVKDLSNNLGAFGEKEFTVNYEEDGQKKTTVLPMYSGTEGNISYTLDHPVFLKDKAYKFALHAYEEYVNKDNGEKRSVVPLSNMNVEVDDKIAMSNFYINQDSLVDQPRSLALDENGKGIYKFTGGYPNMNNDLLKTMQFTFIKGSNVYQWMEGGYKAYVLGDQPESGQNFISKGPDQVDFILRDPAGSNSYSYMAKGSVLTTTNSNLYADGTHLDQNFTLSFGGDVYLMQAPLGIGIMVKTDIKADVTEDFHFDYTTTNSKSMSSTIETSNTISTSGEPDYVGAMADVFIGRSTNLLFGASNNLGFYPNKPADEGEVKKTVTDGSGNTFYLYKNQALSMGVTFATQFAYTQNHIKGYLIPEIQKMRDKMIKVEPEYFSSSVALPANQDTTYQYYSLVPANDPAFGKENTYRANPPDGNKAPKTNEVAECNSWIAGWEKTLKSNEDDKLKAFQGSATRNESFDGGATRSYSRVFTTDTTDTRDVTWNTDIAVGTDIGFEILGIGSNVKLNLGYSHQTGNTIDTTKTTSIETGYEMIDPDQGDTHTIDVYDKGDLGFIFRQRAGQTSCPWEDAEMTEYQDGEQKELSTATKQIEKPQLVITNSSLADIPAGRSAFFELKMSNNSEAGIAVPYKLWVDEDTNPNGLALFIDGQALGSGRVFTINPGTNGTQVKTLEVRQTKLDVMDYEDIMLHLTSTCQDDPNSDMGWIHSDASFTIRFKPSSSPLTLNIATKDRVVNQKTGNNLYMEVTDFDPNFSGFDYIRLKYKPANSNAVDWQTFKSYKTKADLPEANAELIEGTTLRLKLEMDNTTFPDRRYLFCAFSEGNNSVVASAEIEVVKDMKGPQVMGNPSPANGILTPEGEISVVFNELINTADMIADNVQAKGVLNGHKLTHNTGLNFAGGEPAATELPIILPGNSFTMEAWVKHTPGTPGTLFRHGAGNQSITVGFTQDGSNNDLLKVVVNGQQILSGPLDKVAGWQYISVAYNADNQTISANALYDATNKVMLNAAKLTVPYSAEGRFYIGEGFTGIVQEVTLWSKARRMEDLSDKDQSKSGYEKNLTGYWPIDECNGTVASDKVRARHLLVPNVSYWYIGTENKSYHFGGDGYLTFNTATIPVTSDENFTLEFWFNGTESQQANATLFSCGKGIGDYGDSRDKLSVGFVDNKLTLHAAGQSYQLSNSSYLDGSWHHFALNVTRLGSVMVYVDGVSKKQLAATAVGGFASAEMLIGACGYNKPDGSDNGWSFVVEENSYFNGYIDEVRIWKASLSADNMRLNIYNRLEGNEAGLIAYLPFEEIVKEQGLSTVVASLKDKVQNVEAVATHATSAHIAPNLKEVRALETIPITYVASDNKIVIKLPEGMTSRIENCTLEFLIERIRDLNGNALAGAIKWTGFVNMNRLKWGSEQISITQEVQKTTQFEMLVSNQSGKTESYVLTNLPAWLTASKTSGSLKPLTSEKIFFTVAESTPVGSYEGTVYLTGSNEVDEPLAVNLKVTGTKPNWSLDPKQYEQSMSLIGQVLIENQYQEDSEDIIGAFIGEECVGLASPEFLSEQNGYFLFMTIYGNSDTHTGKEVTFRLWDAGSGRIYPSLIANEKINFSDNLIKGTMQVPIQLNALDRIEQSMSVTKGWNWFSVNVEKGELTNMAQFKNSIGTVGQTLKGQRQFTEYSLGAWKGQLTTISTDKMYMLQATAAAKLNFIGRPSVPSLTPVTLNPGWSWIGYTPQFSASVKDALAGITPKTNDMLKGQMQFAVYSGTGWSGSLRTLTPGAGYMYFSGSGEAQTFVYPSQSASVKSGGELRSATADERRWTARANDFESNMSLIGTVVLNGREIEEGRYELGAFLGNECRGSILLEHDKELGRSLAYLTIHGNDNDLLNFRLYDHASETEWNAVQPVNVSYSANAILGNLSIPYPITFSGATGIDDVPEGGYHTYPARVDSRIYFNYQPELIERIEVVQSDGRIVMRMDKVTDNFVDVSRISGGVCFLRVTYKGKVRIHEFIKK